MKLEAPCHTRLTVNQGNGFRKASTTAFLSLHGTRIQFRLWPTFTGARVPLCEGHTPDVNCMHAKWNHRKAPGSILCQCRPEALSKTYTTFNWNLFRYHLNLIKQKDIRRRLKEWTLNAESSYPTAPRNIKENNSLPECTRNARVSLSQGFRSRMLATGSNLCINAKRNCVVRVYRPNQTVCYLKSDS
jgi:hypothetical protein